MQNIIIPKGFRVGHADNGVTGVTVILCEEGATGGVDVRGCAPGTRETDLLRPEKAVEKVNAVALCGGSAFGLDACGGVMQYLRERGCGHRVGEIVVPLVSGAVIFDLNHGYIFPDSTMGFKACENAKNDEQKWGRIGVGTGATIGKIFGKESAVSGGVGASTIISGDVVLTVITALNALGDVYNPESGQIVSGARAKNGEFLNTQQLIINAPNPSKSADKAPKNTTVKSDNKTVENTNAPSMQAGGNTTLSCIITNAKLDKLKANKLASIAHNGLAQCIKPVHTDYDGDTIFALSHGTEEIDFTKLSCMATQAVIQSVLNIF